MIQAALKDRGDLLPSLSIALSSVFWGIYWIPLRYLEERGIAGIWPSLVLNSALLLAFAPVVLWRVKMLKDAGPRFLLDCLWLGFAITLYGASVVFTDVVRAVLLFYLSPAWSTIIGLIWLGERLTFRRLGALAFGFTGLFVILGVEEGLPLPRNMGDWMALVSGVTWAIGSTVIFTSKRYGSLELTFGFAFWGVLSGLLIYLALPDAVIGAVPAAERVTDNLAVIAGAGLLLVGPCLFLTVWGTRRLSPARVGILLMGEIVVGVSTAAALTDEPFGTREMTGAVLVVAAGILEVLPSFSKRARVQ